MDGNRFDDLSKALFQQRSRRSVFKVIGGGIAGLFAARGGLNVGQISAAATAIPCALTCPANITASNEPDVCAATVNYAAPTGTGTCGPIICTPASGSDFSIGSTTVSCSDGSTGNCSFTVTVNDTQPPQVTCPANITVSSAVDQCDAVVNYVASALDPCGVMSLVCNPPSGSAFPVGSTTTTCSAADPAGNTATCSFSVTVIDTQPPSIICSASMTVPNDPGQCGAVIDFAPVTSTDNCEASTPTCIPPTGSFFPLGNTPVTCSTVDDAGNTAACGFTVTVNDEEGPNLACPADIVAGTDPGQCTAIVTYSAPSATDCSSVGVITCAPPSGGAYPVGTTTVTCNAVDGENNEGECTFTITVNDSEPPVVACPADIVQNNDPGQCGAVVTFAPSATDNCPGLGAFVCGPPSGSFFEVGNTTVNCGVTDGGDNADDCAFTITIIDVEPPTVTCPPDVAVNAEPGSSTALVDYESPDASDNCPSLNIECDPASGSEFPVGVTQVTCVVTDGAGNDATCSFDVTVNAVAAASLTIHSRECQSDSTGDIFDACHDNIAESVTFDVDDGVDAQTVTTDENGEASVVIAEGTTTLAKSLLSTAGIGRPAPPVPEAHVICADSVTGEVLVDETSSSVSFAVEEGADITCDWYDIIAPAGEGVTELPSTGGAPSDSTSDFVKWGPLAAVGGAAAFVAARLRKPALFTNDKR